MDPLSVFICYRHLDPDAGVCRQLREVVLKPLVAEGLIDLWVDEPKNAPGDAWRANILAGLERARIGLVLFSQNLIASTFVRETELPTLFRREAAGELTLIPIVVAPFDEAFQVRWQDANGEPRCIRPAERQGIYSFGSGTWLDADDGTRARKDQALIKRIRALAVERPWQPGPSPTPESMPQDPPAVQPPPAHPALPEGVLACWLARGGDGLSIQHRPLSADAAPLTWSPDVLAAMLAELEQAPEDAGQTLFRLLFGDGDRWPSIAAALFPANADRRPQVEPVRLRIITADPELLGLPWGRLACDGLRLIDYHWEIVTASAPVPRRRCQTHVHADALMVTDAAPISARPGSARHRSPVAALFAQLRPRHRDAVVEVSSVADLRHALQRSRPQVVCIELACDATHGEPVLLLGPDDAREPFPVQDLEQALLRAEPAPCLLILALRGAAAAQLMARLAARLGERIALVLRLATGDAQTARHVLLALLRAWLGEGKEPVAALHRLLRTPLPGDADGPLSADPACIGIHADVLDWRTDPDGRSRHDPLPRLALDREDQKAGVNRMLDDLVKDPRLRVLSIVAYGTPDNRLAELPEQLRWDAEDRVQDSADITPVRIDLPAPRPDLADCLPGHVAQTLRAAPGEAPGALLRRQCPPGLRPGTAAVLWLDWGLQVHDGSKAQGAAIQAALDAVIRYAARHLAAACPDDLRLVCMLCIELPEDRNAGIEGLLRHLRSQPWHRSDRCKTRSLQPLGQVDEQHLSDYLAQIHTELDRLSRDELVGLILARTQGAFDATVALLEQGRNASWPDLLLRLRGADTEPSPAEPEQFL